MKELLAVARDDQNSFPKLIPVTKNPVTMGEIIKFMISLFPLIITDMLQVSNSLHNLRNFQILVKTKTNIVRLGLKTVSCLKQIWNFLASENRNH